MRRLSAIGAVALTAALFCVTAATPAPARRRRPPKLPKGVRMLADLTYGRGGGRDLKLDLFLPKEDERRHPAIVFIHGGGWSGGAKGQFWNQAAYLAGEGYAAACVEYRLSGEARFPAAVEDCKCAIRWLRAHAKPYQVDPERIAVGGGSAGAHLAAMVGVTDRTAGLEGAGGYGDVSSRVRAVVAFNGVFDMFAMMRGGNIPKPITLFLGGGPDEARKNYELASPIRHVDKGDPPFLLLHGTGDSTVPFEQSKAMQKKLKSVGVTAELFAAEGANHGFFNRPPWYEPTLQRMKRFLDEQLRAK